MTGINAVIETFREKGKGYNRKLFPSGRFIYAFGVLQLQQYTRQNGTSNNTP
jgi:hypothetical protein